ncbi:MAG: GNAT family N-acetyltransferase [Salinispira sp.]
MTNKNFVLSDELLEQILFGMENQHEEFFLNIQTMQIIEANELSGETDETDENTDNLIMIPEWQPVDGYNLMETFIINLHNPPAKNDLHKSLQGGRGVFRQFKIILKKYPEIERRWFSFREKHMKKRVRTWFNEIRESRGLAALKVEIHDTEELVLSDFTIREVTSAEELQLIAERDRQSFEECFLQQDDADYWYGFRRNHLPAPHDREQGSFTLGAYNPAGNLCAFLWALHDEISQQKRIAHILQLFVEPEFRGLGIAGTLITSYISSCENEGIGSIVLESFSHILGDLLTRHGFTRFTRFYGRGAAIALRS